MSLYDSITDNSQRNTRHDIRFINSQYDELFRIHDGGQIHVEKPEGGSYEIYQLKDIPENRDIHFE